MQPKKPDLRFKEFSDAWDKKRLSALLFEHKERNYQREFDRNDVLSVSRNNGIVNQIEHLGRSYAGASVLNYHIVRKNDIVYTKSPLALNPYGIIKANKNKEGIVSTLYAVYRCKKNVNSDFIDFYFSLDDHLNKYLRPLVQKGAKNDMKINNQRVLIDPIYIPKTEREQEKISSFLTSVDNKIEQLINKETLLQQYKKGVMQKIFNQEIRFKKDDGSEFEKWKYKNGDKIFKPITNKNHNSDLPVLAISQEFGAVPREMINYKISVTKKSISTYKVVEEGDFIISLRSFQGGIEYSNYKGICSPAYIILRPFIDVNRSFYKFYFKTDRYIRLLNRHIEGIRDGKMISYRQFSDIKLPYPSPAEQSKIADFLSSIDSRIEKVQNKLKQTKEFKKGLLQRMFV
ncbi:restriction endonuclease subunit S [Arcobacter cloacae]|uniref:Restriction endonuclease subunit S n=1 Tax=Arcobacter cloacae TaxID=1054034 RepID=A0A4Q0ZG70_9BACT|nr:restriction endonuclease subunit S [Arcobacter cloacae]RXJ85497.1 restriction endonuclease subunit S [Arcobacter cloacae]